jgi:modulator of FtsH protease HflK
MWQQFLLFMLFFPIPVRIKTILVYLVCTWLLLRQLGFNRLLDKIDKKFRYLLGRYSSSATLQMIYNKVLDVRDFLGGNLFRFIVGFVLAGIWVLSGVFIVQLNENGAVLRFGELSRICKPGLNWHMPWPFERVIITDVTSLHKISTGTDEILVLTKDENLLSVHFTIFWRVKDLSNYLFRAKSPDSIVQSVAELVMREIMCNTEAHEALTSGRQELADQIKYKLQTLLDKYNLGIEVVDAQMGKIDPPASVIDAYRDVLKAKLEQEIQKNQAESYANYIIPQAQGEAYNIKSKAEARAAEILGSAEGEAKAIDAMLRSYQSDPDLAKNIMYTKMMQKVLTKSKLRIFKGNLVQVLNSGTEKIQTEKENE